MTRPRGGDRRLLLVALLLPAALWAWLVEIQGLQQALSSPIPPAFDQFEASIRRLTPLTARIEVAGDPPVLVFERSVTELYPRTVFTAVDTNYMHVHQPLQLTWPDLLRTARRDGAAYLFVWLPGGARGSPSTPVILRRGPGTLVAVR